ncbi:MAG: hypothetical protein ACREJB_01515 [Planctomycetaceae bacterium]
MQHKRPVPLIDSSGRPRRMCPVCGAPSYSREGIHPQCAVERADATRMARVKAARNRTKQQAKHAESLVLLPWHKRCPKCNAQMHIRKATCECGHRFGA